MDKCISASTAPNTLMAVTLCDTRPNAPLKVWSCNVVEQADAKENVILDRGGNSLWGSIQAELQGMYRNKYRGHDYAMSHTASYTAPRLHSNVVATATCLVAHVTGCPVWPSMNRVTFHSSAALKIWFENEFDLNQIYQQSESSPGCKFDPWDWSLNKSHLHLPPVSGRSALRL